MKHRYIDAVVLVVRSRQLPRLEGRLELATFAMAPDRRRRDLHNILKCLIDSPGKAGCFEDDGHIDDLHVIRVLLEGERKWTVDITPKQVE